MAIDWSKKSQEMNRLRRNPVLARGSLLAAIILFALPPLARGQQQWEELVSAAKKEGRLTLLGPAEPEARVQLPAAFKDRFGVTVEYIGARGQEAVARLQAEHLAGQYYFDVVIAGTQIENLRKTGAFEPIRPVLIHPDASDSSKWKLGGLFFLDPPKQYLLRLSIYTTPLRVINTDYVKPEELSWQGLIDRKWKGKISTYDLSGPGTGRGQAVYLLHRFGEDYFTRLYVGQQVVTTRDRRQQSLWLARGVYPIAIALDKREYAELKKDGFPVAMLPNTKEVPGNSTSGSGYTGLVKKAPHPAATKLFLNWLITKEGQEVFNRAMGVPALRNDLDDSWVIKESIVQPGWDYLDTDNLEFREEIEPKLIKRMKELLSKR